MNCVGGQALPKSARARTTAMVKIKYNLLLKKYEICIGRQDRRRAGARRWPRPAGTLCLHPCTPSLGIHSLQHALLAHICQCSACGIDRPLKLGLRALILSHDLTGQPALSIRPAWLVLHNLVTLHYFAPPRFVDVYYSGPK